jgi:hypothetical protein
LGLHRFEDFSTELYRLVDDSRVATLLKEEFERTSEIV